MSDTDPRGDDVYQPPEPDQPGEAQPDMENALAEPGLDERLDTGESPPERPYAATDHGITQREQREGETLDERLAREVPEPGPERSAEDDGVGDLSGGEGEPVDPQVGATRAGRLAPAPETTRGADRHIAVRGTDVGIDGGAATAEEAAVHVIEDQDEDKEP
ncbi:MULTISPECIES: DUF5709 domain-containing protein [unclassified Streptomyces]|uniref:DUF5709 domain-containing protein n=1 Tax=unclassified Streptomyces TaxID=2593676 RepID=UPI001BE9DD24|nr:MULTISPECIES: DUF5709 domain-containing protein [unclassified Streptomyces]MBT2407613.1 hypothetical protein [Streptomyces sp. ISL-21]MBT2459079.1 hypothetical protein [Streptomyces sp. ISL-86]MBT2611607.1 hypothetical protein [Streptomyces sp. ISL-87]